MRIFAIVIPIIDYKTTMTHTINFSIHRNPRTDAEGRTTYQVRHESQRTMNKSEFLNHLANHQSISPAVMEMALAVLQDEIVEQLLANRRLHLEGLGTFYLKIGLRQQYDDEGNPVATQFTDPNAITGRDVCIDTIGFMPDKAFLSLIDNDISFKNITGRGAVGHSATYTDEQFKDKLSAYLEQHRTITCPQLMREFGITKYMAWKWLDYLSKPPVNFLKRDRVGHCNVFCLNE